MQNRLRAVSGGKLKAEVHSLGGRIAAKRAEKRVTQDTLAKIIDRNRSIISQYENGDTVPPIDVLTKIANELDTSVDYLVNGIEHVPEIPAVQRLGYTEVHEVAIDTAEHIETLNVWAMPTPWLRSELGFSDPSTAVIYQVHAAYIDSKYQMGDRLLLDTSAQAKRVSPPGTFVYWDGVGATIGDIMIKPGPKGRPVASVKTDSGTFEADPDKLSIIGRVKAFFRKAG